MNLIYNVKFRAIVIVSTTILVTGLIFQNCSRSNFDSASNSQIPGEPTGNTIYDADALPCSEVILNSSTDSFEQCNCTALNFKNTSGVVGTGVYKKDVNICGAARHSGRVSNFTRNSTISVYTGPACTSFSGSTRNGVNSSSGIASTNTKTMYFHPNDADACETASSLQPEHPSNLCGLATVLGPFTNRPTSNLCISTANSTQVQSNQAQTQWVWTCSKLGVSEICQVAASPSNTPQNGVCGSAASRVYTSTDTLESTSPDLCVAGTAGQPNFSNSKWNWTCSGSDGGNPFNCSSQNSITNIGCTLNVSVSWTGTSGATCSGRTSQQDGSEEIASSTANSGRATFQCVNGTWTEQSNSTCQAPTTPISTCGSENGSTASSATLTASSSNLCAAGNNLVSSSFIPNTATSTYAWSCRNASAASPASCSSSYTPNPTNGGVTTGTSTPTTHTVTVKRLGRGGGTVSASGGCNTTKFFSAIAPSNAPADQNSPLASTICNSSHNTNVTFTVITDSASRLIGWQDPSGSCPSTCASPNSCACVVAIDVDTTVYAKIGRIDDFNVDLPNQLTGPIQSMNGQLKIRFATADVNKYAAIYALVQFPDGRILWHTNTGSNPLHDASTYTVEDSAKNARFFIDPTATSKPQGLVVNNNGLIKIDDNNTSLEIDWLNLDHTDLRAFPGVNYYAGYGLSDTANPGIGGGDHWLDIISDLVNFAGATTYRSMVGRWNLVVSLPAIDRPSLDVIGSPNSGGSKLSNLTIPIKVKVKYEDFFLPGHLFVIAHVTRTTPTASDRLFTLVTGDGSLCTNWQELTSNNSNLTDGNSLGSSFGSFKQYNSTRPAHQQFLGDADFEYSKNNSQTNPLIYTVKTSGLSNGPTGSCHPDMLTSLADANIWVGYGTGSDVKGAWTSMLTGFAANSAAAPPWYTSQKGGFKQIPLSAFIGTPY